MTFEAGHSIQVSKSCNPNFIIQGQLVNWLTFDCDEIKSVGFCDYNLANYIIRGGSWNTNGHLETFLQCPQCGCGSEGAANLNDLYDLYGF